MVDDLESATGIDPRRYFDEVDILKEAQKAGAREANSILSSMAAGHEAGLKKTAPDVMQRIFDGLEDAQKEGYRRGYVRALFEEIGEKGDEVDRTLIFRTPTMRQRLRTLFGDKADLLMGKIFREKEMFSSNALSPSLGEMRGGAASFSDLIDGVVSIGDNVAGGRPVSLISSLMKANNDAEVWTALPETREELASIILSTELPVVIRRLAQEKAKMLAKREATLAAPIIAGEMSKPAYELIKPNQNFKEKE